MFQYYNAYCAAMHDPSEPLPVRLLCVWHVLKNWKGHLIGMKSEDREYMMACLRTILETQDNNNVKNVFQVIFLLFEISNLL